VKPHGSTLLYRVTARDLTAGGLHR